MAVAGISWMICLLLVGGIPPLPHSRLGALELIATWESHPAFPVSCPCSFIHQYSKSKNYLPDYFLDSRDPASEQKTAAVAAQGWEGKSSCNSITITPKVAQGPFHFSDSWLRAWSFSCSLLDSNFPCKIYPIYISSFRNLFKKIFLTLDSQTSFFIESSEMVLKNPLLSPST